MLKGNGYFKRSIICFLLCSIVTILAACESFEENSYKTLKSMAVAYSSAMDVAYEHYQTIKDEEEKAEFWATVTKYADPVVASIKTAKTACMAYSRAVAAYNAALAASGEGADLDELKRKVSAAKAAASAALQAVDVAGLKDAIETMTELF